jgi:predicted nucleotide-binding protein
MPDGMCQGQPLEVLEALLRQVRSVLDHERMQGFANRPGAGMDTMVIQAHTLSTILARIRNRVAVFANTVERRIAPQRGTYAPTGASVFIGHGRDRAWLELKNFLEDRLGLPVVEFNVEPAAGVATTERLGDLLQQAGFALLVCTAEDSHQDGLKHARENVVHEIGLFQGRLGFRKAIVLLEENCQAFSNIAGLGHIRFPPGRISAAFEEARMVLEREGVFGPE